MRFISLFSGIEAASVALLPLGWECAAFAEIEPFPCAVLKHHYPNVPNLGDVSLITREQIEALGHIDAVFYGFPCQDLSVAGKRKGLKHADGTNTRSGLFYHASNIIAWSKARWSVAENVPGLFSSNEGRDFAAVAGELAGAEFDVPGDGWRSSGVALGRRGLVEWFVLDAQWRGLAQRRKRVFLVLDTGNWSDRPPFFPLTESLLRNPPPSRASREGTAAGVAPSIGASGRGFSRAGETRGQDPVIPIQEIGKRQSGTPMNGVGHGQPGDPMYTLQSNAQHGICATMTKNYATHHGRTGGNNGGVAENQLIPEVAWALQERDSKGSDSSTKEGHLLPVAFDTTQVTSKTNRSSPQPGDPCHTIAKGSHVPALAFTQNQAGDVLTGSVAAAIGTNSSATGRNTGKVMHPIALQTDITPKFGDVAFTLKQPSPSGGGQPQAVATGMAVRRLTPKECCRLQGFPDDYLDILYRGKPACDGVKYKALGNSMAVPVISWIGSRIQLVESLKTK